MRTPSFGRGTDQIVARVDRLLGGAVDLGKVSFPSSKTPVEIFFDNPYSTEQKVPRDFFYSIVEGNRRALLRKAASFEIGKATLVSDTAGVTAEIKLLF